MLLRGSILSPSPVESRLMLVPADMMRVRNLRTAAGLSLLAMRVSVWLPQPGIQNVDTRYSWRLGSELLNSKIGVLTIRFFVSYSACHASKGTVRQHATSSMTSEYAVPSTGGVADADKCDSRDLSLIEKRYAVRH